LEFDLGQDAQGGLGEAQAEIYGTCQTVQMFVMRLNYSKARFVMAFPFQNRRLFLKTYSSVSFF